MHRGLELQQQNNLSNCLDSETYAKGKKDVKNACRTDSASGTYSASLANSAKGAYVAGKADGLDNVSFSISVNGANVENGTDVTNGAENCK